MSWSLEIHHLYFSSSGDATIIVARHPAVGANAAITKTVLIDGGRSGTANVIHPYLTNTLNINRVDVIAITHYDEDHFYGVSKLLARRNVTTYDRAIIYDPGRLPQWRETRARENQYGRRQRVPSEYGRYLGYIAAKPNVRRATARVNSFHIVHYDANDLPTLPTPANSPATAGYLSPDWLIGKDILWGNGLDGVGANAFAENPPAHAPNPPRIICIAANKYVRQADNTVRFISNVNIYNGPTRMTNDLIADYENVDENAKSLGFLIMFNQFRYFVGGDLERLQEDGANTVHGAPAVFYSGVKHYINQTDTITQRIVAMKTSHHGAETASSRDFITRMRPAAAFISCGRKNKFQHPRPSTINALDGYPEAPVLASPNNRHPLPPPAPPLRPVKHYLTGYQHHTLNPARSLGGQASRTAGPAGGTIKLTVDQAQSNRPATGQVYRGLQAIVTEVANTAGVPMAQAQINAIADRAARVGTIYAVALAIGGTDVMATAALNAAAYAGDDLDFNDQVRHGLLSAAIAASINPAAVGAAGSPLQAAIDAALRFGGGQRVALIAADAPNTAITRGVAAALGAALAGQLAANITQTAQNAGAPQPVAQAAGFAAAIVFARFGALAAGFAAAAACGAARANCPVGQAAALAAAIGGMAAGANASVLATITTTAALNAGLGAGRAALAGAIASASHHDGAPNPVFDATSAALAAAGFGQRPRVATAARNAATLAHDNTLFRVLFRSGNNNENIAHAG